MSVRVPIAGSLVVALALALAGAIAGHEVGFRRGQQVAAAGGAAQARPAAGPAASGLVGPASPGAPASLEGTARVEAASDDAGAVDPRGGGGAVDPAREAAASGPPHDAPASALAHDPAPERADAASPDADEPPPAWASAESASPGLLAFETVRFDFGAVAHGTVAEHGFRYRNEGASTVEIRDVRSSCGCTAAEPTRRTLAPGAEGVLTVRFDTARKPVTGLRQRMSSQVYVDVVAPDLGARGRGSVRLTIEGEALAHYATVPQAGLFFASAVKGQPSAVARVEVFPSVAAAAAAPPAPPAAAAPLVGSMPAPPAAAPPPAAGPAPLDPAAVRVTRAPPGLEVRAIEATERDGRRGVALDCVLGAGAPIGSYSDTLHLSTGQREQAEVVIAVRAFVQPPVRAMPPRITLGAGTTALPVVRVLGPRALEALSAVVVPAAGQAPPFRAEPRPGGQVALLAAEHTVEAQGGLAGEVWVFVDAPTYPLVRIPYHLLDGPWATSGPLRAGDVTVSPAQVQLGDIESGQRRATELSVTDASGAPLALAEVAVTPAAALEVEVRPAAAGPVARLLVRTRADAPTGPITGRLTFRPRPGAEPVVVPVVARVLAPWAADPDALWLAGAGPARATIRSRSGTSAPRGPTDLEVAGAPAGLSARIEAGPAGAIVLIVERAQGSPAPARPTLLGDVVLRPRRPDAARLEVRLPVVGAP